MAKKKACIPLLCLTSIVFLPWCISFTFQKSLESWITNWWNMKESEIVLNTIQEKSILKKLLEFEELFLLDEMLKEYPETRLQNLRIEIYKETIQLIETNNLDRIHTIFHFCTNIICFLILSGYSIRGFHSTQGWELMIGSVYKDFGFTPNDQILSCLVSIFPVILDTIFKYSIFRYLNRVSPSLVVIYHSMKE
ncbi:unnamed protein product [Vicia faba]|uniref:Chloroplast envelope membrane protein n=1 Tax=Vicia faba TaxID=3906 RepID=A0AAV0YF15_VICFA|nr:unnamed protein product [Vicia faba]CAI8583117.1 unnamed protein product [Vicia faba]CAI8583128.1 unnamed protein product [Vicia faba]CAI8583226.1 unnamed protein product [Vicia faba]CAI8583334.1 unnamed protein product [Vicia faba]